MFCLSESKIDAFSRDIGCGSEIAGIKIIFEQLQYSLFGLNFGSAYCNQLTSIDLTMHVC